MNFASYKSEMMMMDPVMCCPSPQHRDKITTGKEWWELILTHPSILQQPPEPDPLPGIHRADGDWQLGANYLQIGERLLK